jgi:hypothetical protein
MRSFTRAIRAPQGNIRSSGAVRPTVRSPLHRLQSTVGNETMCRLVKEDVSGSNAIEAAVESARHLPGQPLPASVRAEMEQRFGEDLGDVRLHVGREAAESAAAVDASAYTVGRDIVFGTGNYAPDSASGRELLMHELAHVVQQGRGGAAPSAQSETHLEAGAREAAAAVMQGSGSVEVSGASGVGLARQEGGLRRLLRTEGLFPHRVTFKNLEEFAKSDAGDGVQNLDGTWTGIVWRPYPESSLAAPPPAPKQKPAQKPAPKKTEPPTDIHLLMDYLEATRPRLIYPKPVRHIFGGLQFVGGGLEAIGGAVGGIGTAETGVGLLGGIVVTAHGLDIASSGLYTLWTGEESTTYTHEAGAGWAYTFGADPKMAAAVGQSIDIIVGSSGLILGASSLEEGEIASFTPTEETPSYRVIYYHGQVGRPPRDIVTVDTPGGVRAFYSRTGGGGANTGGAQPGDWAPFEGFSSESGVFPYRGNLYEASEGWFVKHRFTFGMEEGHPLYRFGTPENLDISRWLATQPIPVGRPSVPWQQVQPELKFFGVPTIDPIPYYGRVRGNF